MSAVPSVYTETTIAEYMARCLGPRLVAILGWTAEADISSGGLSEWAEPVAETLLLLEISDLTEWVENDDLLAIRAVAKWVAWVHARMSLAEAYDSSSGVTSRSRNQLYKNAENEERLAGRYAAQYATLTALPSLVMTVVPESAYDIAEDEAEFG